MMSRSPAFARIFPVAFGAFVVAAGKMVFFATSTDERHEMGAKSSAGFSFAPKKFGTVVVVKDNVS